MKRELCDEPDPEVCRLFIAYLTLCGVPNTYGYVQQARENVVWALKYRGYCIGLVDKIPRLQKWEDCDPPPAKPACL